MTNALDYNERKADGVEGVLEDMQLREYLASDNLGHVVATFNVPDISTLNNEFFRLLTLNRRSTRGRPLQNPSFHMSINPGENDRPMDEATVVAFTQELMEQLGYGDNPYRIFRHDDTGRTHYHVVSTRIGQDGKKIKDSFENARCERICNSLASKYGFVLGNAKEETAAEQERVDDTEEETPVVEPQTPVIPTNAPEAKDSASEKEDAPEGRKKAEEKEKIKKKFVPPFRLNAEADATQQYRDIHADAMTWHFTTPEQYGALLRWRYNVEAKTYNDDIYFVGLDAKGLGCTPPKFGVDMGLTAMKDILQRCADTDIKRYRRQKERLEKLASETAEKSVGWDDYRRQLEKKGIYMVVSWTDKDEPFGLTWIDRGTKCIWKGSETDVDLKWLRGVCEEKHWTMKRHRRHERKSVVAARPSQDKEGITTPPTGEQTSRSYSGSLSTISTAKALKELMTIHGVKQSQHSNADVTREKKPKYGEEDNNIDIVI